MSHITLYLAIFWFQSQVAWTKFRRIRRPLEVRQRLSLGCLCVNMIPEVITVLDNLRIVLIKLVAFFPNNFTIFPPTTVPNFIWSNKMAHLTCPISVKFIWMFYAPTRWMSMYYIALVYVCINCIYIYIYIYWYYQ